jgi:UDP-3-O-[3-hydroxymyristoyl] glucosamine N-acyltransferase
MLTLGQIAAILNAPVRGGSGDTQQSIAGVASLAEAQPGDISYLSADSHLRKFQATRASAVIVDKRVRLPAAETTDRGGPAVLIVDDAELAMAKVLQLFAPPVPRPPAGVDPAARVATDVVLAEGVALGPSVVVGQRTRIGARTVLHPGVVVGADVVIGSDCEIFPNVVVRERITIGSRVIIHAGSVLGSDGFGYRWDGSKHVKIPQIGTVIVEDDVEIGSCVCIDRAKTGITRVGRGTKIDNLVQIAHNCTIGDHCIIVGQAGLAGSVVLGNRVVLGGQTAVRDHVSLGDGAAAAACSAVADDIAPGMVVSGTPALPHRQSLREGAAMRRLPDLVAQVRKLQDQIDRLKNKR